MSLLVPGDGHAASPKCPGAPKATEATDPGPWSCSCPGVCRSTGSSVPSCLLPLKSQLPTKSGLESELGKLKPLLLVSWPPSRPCPWYPKTLGLGAAVREVTPFTPAHKATQPLQGPPILPCSLVASGSLGTSWPCHPCHSHAGEPRLGPGSASSHPGLNTWAPRVWEWTAGENVFWHKKL